MKHELKLALLIFAFMIFPILLLIGIFLFGRVSMDIQNARIEKEVFSYVLENRDTLSKDSPKNFSYIPYTEHNDIGVTISYGYFYSENMNHYDRRCKEDSYRNGYKVKGYPTDEHDWYYVAKICDNWYYYEEHDG